MKLILTAFFGLIASYAQNCLACQINPAEVFWRPLFRGAPMFKTNSAPDQFVGRTTLASGSVTVTVSTREVNSDSIVGLLAQAALPAGYTTAGATSIAAGAAVAVQSTTAIYSGQGVFLGYQSSTNQASGQGRGFRVNSIVDGTSFVVATEDGQSVSSGPAVINWRIDEAVPAGIKVNTISPGNFMTLGWADGKARPVDAVLMWDIKKAG